MWLLIAMPEQAAEAFDKPSPAAGWRVTLVRVLETMSGSVGLLLVLPHLCQPPLRSWTGATARRKPRHGVLLSQVHGRVSLGAARYQPSPSLLPVGNRSTGEPADWPGLRWRDWVVIRGGSVGGLSRPFRLSRGRRCTPASARPTSGGIACRAGPEDGCGRAAGLG